MIDEEATYNKYGYCSTDLSPQSHKPVICVCDGCGSIRETRKGRVRNLCPSCNMVGERNPMFGKPMLPQTRKAILEANSGKNNWTFGKPRSAEHRKKISDNHADVSGANNPMYGKHLSDETKRKLSIALAGKKRSPLTAEHRKKISDATRGRVVSAETRRMIGDKNRGSKHTEAVKATLRAICGEKHPWFGKKHTEASKEKNRLAHAGKLHSQTHKQHISAGLLGIEYDEWSDYADPDKYCHRFNETCREHNRDRYHRKCFICGKTEEQNAARLSVHHVDRNKNQGCADHDWRLIPVCKVCHPALHTATWESRLNYLLDLERTVYDVS